MTRAKASGRATKSTVSADDAAALAREEEALTWRQTGLSYREIGKRMGISGEGARKCVVRAMDRLRPVVEERAEEVRELELARLDIATQGLMPKVEDGNAQAVDKLVKVMERRARLLGLDAPTKSQINVDVTTLTDEQLEALARGT